MKSEKGREGGKKTDVRDRMTDDRGRKERTEVRCQMSDDRGEGTDVGDQKSEGGGRRPGKDRGRRAEDGGHPGEILFAAGIPPGSFHGVKRSEVGRQKSGNRKRHGEGK